MAKVVIYNQDNGIPAVVMPTQEALDKHGIMAIAIKDVPAGKPFKILDAADLPDAPQEAWVVDDADLNDGVGGGGGYSGGGNGHRRRLSAGVGICPSSTNTGTNAGVVEVLYIMMLKPLKLATETGRLQVRNQIPYIPVQ